MNILNNINALLEALKTEDILKYNYNCLERKIYTPYIDEALDKIFGNAPVESKDPSKAGKFYKVQRIYIKTNIQPEYEELSLELYDNEKLNGKMQKGKSYIPQLSNYIFLKRVVSLYYNDKEEKYAIRNVADYIRGYAFPIDVNSKKQPIKIMKILNNIIKDKNYEKFFNIHIANIQRNSIQKILTTDKNAFLKLVDSAFNERPKFVENSFDICVSRLPSDVAGMSTDQRWVSCMELPGYNPKKPEGGCFHQVIERDIKLGTIVAYLIDSDPKARDLNTIKPYARISAKPFINENDEKDFILVAEDTYYADNILSVNVYNEFKELFSKWLLKKQDAIIKDDVIYNKHSALYNDDKKTTYIKENLPEEKQKIYNKLKYYYNTRISPLTTLYKYISNTTNEKFLMWFFNNIKKIKQFTIKELTTLDSREKYYSIGVRTWENGTFEWNTTNSHDLLYIENWYNGTWLNGKLLCEFWENGTWLNGVWEGGEWYDGTWLNGAWNGGVWHNGTWSNGSWENGAWKNGVWKGGEWYNGYWYNGTWKKGNWWNGYWYNGTWENGRINSKKFKEFIQSKVNPNKFYELENQCSTIEELKQKVGIK